MANEIKIILNAVNNASTPIDSVNGALNRLGSQANNTVSRSLAPLNAALGIGIKTAAAAGTAAIAGLTAAVGASINSAAEMEQRMADIAAVLKTTIANVEPLKDLAKNLGIDPKLKVSADEAAKAIETLARNGLTMDQIMAGAARSTVLMSNATGASFTTSAAIATDALQLFNISAEEMDSAIDSIASVTTTSKFGIEDYRLALANAGGAAKVTGISLTDFNAAIVATSSSFASGSDAGTSFKTFLQRLQPESKPALETMKELGLITEDGANAFFTATGEAKSMAEIAGILNTALSGMSDQQRAAALSTMFGTDALRAAAAMSGYTADEFRALQERMADTSAADMAATKVDTFKGALEILRSVVTGVAIEVGEVFIPIVTSLTRSFTTLVANNKDNIVAFFELVAEKGRLIVENGGLLRDALGEINMLFFNAANGAMNATRSLSALGTRLGMTYDQTILLRDRLSEIFTAFHSVKDSVLSFLKPITDVVAEFVTLNDVFVALGILVTATIIPTIVSITTTIGGLVAILGVVTAAVSAMRNAWENDWGGIKTVTQNVWSFLTSAYEGIKSGTMTWQQVLQEAFVGIISFIRGKLPEWGTVLSEWGTAAWTWITTAAATAVERMGIWLNSLRDYLTANLPLWRTKLVEWSNSGVDWISNSPTLARMRNNLETWRSNLFTWYNNRKPSATEFVNWTVGIVEWIADALPKAITWLGDMISGMIDWMLGPGLTSFMAGMSAMFSGIDTNDANGPGARLLVAILSLIMKTTVAVTEAAGKIGWAIISGIVTAFIPGAEEIEVAIETFVNKLWTKFKQMLGIASPSTIAHQMGVDLIQGLINGFNLKMDSFIVHATAVARLLISNIQSVLSIQSLYNMAWDWVSGLVSGFNAQINSFKISASASAQAILDKIREKLSPTSLYSAGSNLVQGLINGFNSQIDSFRDVHMPSVADSVISKFKGLFGIQSPSKVFHKFGVNLMEGLSEGVLSSLGLAVGATETAGASVLDTASQSVSNVNNISNRNYNISLPGQASETDGSNLDNQILSLMGTLSAVAA